MAKKFLLQIDEVWGFYTKYRERLKEQEAVVVEDPVTNYTITVTVDTWYPFVKVYRKEELLETRLTYDKRDIEKVLTAAVQKYFTPVTEYSGGTKPPPKTEDKEQSDDDKEDSIMSREDDLYYAMCDLLMVALESNDLGNIVGTFGEDMIDDVLDVMLRYLTTEYGAVIYRPTFFKDENGQEVYTEYPYEDSADEEPVANASEK